jgi:hypothetical protein
MGASFKTDVATRVCSAFSENKSRLLAKSVYAHMCTDLMVAALWSGIVEVN